MNHFLKKRLPNLVSLLLFVGGLSMAVFMPLMQGRALAITPSAVNLHKRLEVARVTDVKPADVALQTCKASFTVLTKTPQLLMDEIFMTQSDYDFVARANSPSDLAGSTGATRVGTLNNDAAWKLVHENLNGKINAIQFEAADGSVTPVNGGYATGGASICAGLRMLQITGNEYRGWQMHFSNAGNNWRYNAFTVNSKSPDGTSGQLLYFTFGTSSCPSGPGQQGGGPAINSNGQCTANNFVIAGQPQDLNTGGNTGINAASGDWNDVGHITLNDTAHKGEVYEKKLWYADTVTDINGNKEENWSIYFLKTAAGDRAQLVQSAGKPYCANPIANGTQAPSACSNCIPFIAIHQGINLSHKSGSSGPFDIAQFDQRVHALGGAAATLYDYNGDCSYKGSNQASLNSQSNALIWFFYSTQQSKLVTVFTGGSANESRFSGVYNKFGTDAYQGGLNGCSGRAFLTINNTSSSSVFSTNWDMGQGDCASGAVADGTAHVTTEGGSAGEANFATTSGAITAPPSTDPTHSDEEHPTCETESIDPLSWILCSISNGLANFADWILNTFVIQWMEPTAVGLDPSDPVTGSVYDIWSAFRVYGDIVLVIALIVAVISQAFGGGIVEAYTARKILPRVLIAAILVNTSIYIVAFAVDLSRVVGNGIRDLINEPLNVTGNFSFTLGPGTTLTLTAIITAIVIAVVKLTKGGAVGAGGFGAALLPWVLLFIILPAVLAILGVFITLLFLQAIVLALIISSPVAFALYTLPNTEKYFKVWWDWFFRTLLVFPTFMAILGIANLMSALVSKANQGGGSFFATVIAFFLQFLPLLLVPFSFKLAGGLVGRLNQFLGGYGSKLTEAIKGNPNDMNSLRNTTRRRLTGAISLSRANLIRQGDLPGATRSQRITGRVASGTVTIPGTNMRMRLLPHAEQAVSNLNAEATKLREQLTATGADPEVYAAGGFMMRAGSIITPEMAAALRGFDGAALGPVGSALGENMYFNAKGARITRDLYSRSKTLAIAATNSDIAENVSYAFYKAQTDQERAAARFAYAQNALEGDWSQTEIDSQWAKSVYGRKDIDITQWYSPPKRIDGPNGQRQIVYEDVGEYQAKGGTGNVPANMATAANAEPRSAKKMLLEWNRSRQSYQLGPERDGGFRVNYKWQERLQRKYESGQALTADELQVLGQGYQVVDATSQRLAGAGYDENGVPLVSASGLTPQSQAVVMASASARTTQQGTFSLGTYQPNGQRAIYYTPAGAPQGTPGTLVGNFTSDDTARSQIPRVVAQP